MTKIVIDPVTRVSGLLGVEIQVEDNKVTDAKVTGNQFRGFEKMFIGRPAMDIIRLTPRVCGICSTHHAIASAKALESAMNVVPDSNGKIIRDIANGFELIQNYIRHLYFLVLPDYVDIINVPPLFKSETAKDADYRLSKEDTEKININYREAVKYSREAHRALAILTGKVPHPHGIWIGGITTNIDLPQLEGVKYSINVIKSFIENKLAEDLSIISTKYKEYYKNGKGPGNFMSYGLFNDYDNPNNYCDAGVIIQGAKENLDTKAIAESVMYSWFDDGIEEIIPNASKPKNANPFKNDGYSWVNAPRYKGNAMEVGALARMLISGEYQGGVSTMDRLMAKAYEAIKVCQVLEGLIDMINIGDAAQERFKVPMKAEGIGLIEAERGSLGHWISIDNKKISNFTLISPSTWNMSPMDKNGVKGTVEQALIGLEMEDVNNPVEIGRIIRSFDPCLNCAAHIVSDKYKPITIEIIS